MTDTNQENAEWRCEDCDTTDREECPRSRPCDRCGVFMYLDGGSAWTAPGRSLKCFKCANSRVDELEANHSRSREDDLLIKDLATLVKRLARSSKSQRTAEQAMGFLKRKNLEQGRILR